MLIIIYKYIYIDFLKTCMYIFEYICVSVCICARARTCIYVYAHVFVLITFYSVFCFNL